MLGNGCPDCCSRILGSLNGLLERSASQTFGLRVMAVNRFLPLFHSQKSCREAAAAKLLEGRAKGSYDETGMAPHRYIAARLRLSALNLSAIRAKVSRLQAFNNQSDGMSRPVRGTSFIPSFQEEVDRRPS